MKENILNDIKYSTMHELIHSLFSVCVNVVKGENMLITA